MMKDHSGNKDEGARGVAIRNTDLGSFFKKVQLHDVHFNRYPYASLPARDA